MALMHFPIAGFRADGHPAHRIDLLRLVTFDFYVIVICIFFAMAAVHPVRTAAEAHHDVEKHGEEKK